MGGINFVYPHYVHFPWLFKLIRGWFSCRRPHGSRLDPWRFHQDNPQKFAVEDLEELSEETRVPWRLPHTIINIYIYPVCIYRFIYSKIYIEKYAFIRYRYRHVTSCVSISEYCTCIIRILYAVYTFLIIFILHAQSIRIIECMYRGMICWQR